MSENAKFIYVVARNNQYDKGTNDWHLEIGMITTSKEDAWSFTYDETRGLGWFVREITDGEEFPSI